MKQNTLRLLLHLFIICTTSSVVAAPAIHKKYYFHTLDIQNGLSQNTANPILQDRIGFMWIGTKDGLNRYDGLSFRIFNKENSGLGNNFITTLYEDEDGLLWIGCDAGLYLYSPENERFARFEQLSDKNTYPERSVNIIEGDKEGGIWISVESQGLFYFNTRTREFKNYLCNETGKPIYANVSGFKSDNNGTYWISLYGDNLYYTTDNFQTLIPYTIENGIQPFKGDIINKIAQGAYHCLYIGSVKGGLKEINLTNYNLRDILVTDDNGEQTYVHDVTFYSEDELWVGTESGLFIYYLRNKGVKHLQNVDGDPYSISDNAIYCLYKDREGGMWAGTYFGGISYYPVQYTYFEKFYLPGAMNNIGKRVREIKEAPDGKLWMGTEDKGLFTYHPATGTLQPFIHPAIYHNIHGLCMDGENLWVGTFSKGLYRVHTRTGEVQSYYDNKTRNSLGSDYIFTIYRTVAGDVWFGTTTGLLRYNRETDTFSKVSELEGVFIYDIKEDFNGNLWLATYSQGIFSFDITRREWKNYTYQEENPTSLPANKVLSIFEDSRKNIWFTTQGGGFCRFEPATGTFLRFDSSSGLPNNVVHKIVEDNLGFFWITTNQGLVRFHPVTLEMKVFTVANGLLSNQFNYQSGYKDNQGSIYLGSINGFIAFNPSLFTENTYIPPVVITDFSLFNKRTLPGQSESPLKKSIILSEEIRLRNNQNSFSFRVAALSYQAPGMNKLIYRMDGYDKEWYQADPYQMITYSNLPYGTYTFRVKGSNSDGLWNETPVKLAIHILPPFYLSVWAYFLYIIFSLVIIGYSFFIFHRRHLRRTKRQREKFEQQMERELYTAKIDFFTNIAHEIRTPLTLIKTPLDHVLLQDGKEETIREDLEIMSRNTDRLLELTNQLLDFRKTEIQGIKLNFIHLNISALLHTIYIRFTPLAKQKGIDFSIEYPDTELFADIDQEAFTKIISNLFTNAVKYADSYIQVIFYADEKANFCIRISNDGVIVPPEMREEIFKPFVQYKEEYKDIATGTGIGLPLARSLAELHNGTLSMDNSPAQNCFILCLPLHAEDSIDLQGSPVPGKIPAEETAIIEEKEKKYTLLIVEDHPDMLMFVARRLSGVYEILTAENGQKALGLLDSNIVHLIISDIMMPEMDGLEFCNRLKSDLSYSHIPVILLTAKNNLQSKLEGLRMGADAYIEKPFSMEYLETHVSNLLENREKLRTAFTSLPFISHNTMAHSKADETFLTKLYDVVTGNMQDPDFSLDDMARIMNMSRSSLNRKIRGILDLTPNDYIRLERLKKAASLLQDEECRINEICYQVGFNTPSYFTKCFLKQFGKLPKDFAKKSPSKTSG